METLEDRLVLALDFAAAVNFNVSDEPNSVTAGDFNGDGKADLATSNYYSNNVSVLLGDGLGNFAAAANFNVGDGPISVTVGDFNGDGKVDLATANSNSNNVSVLLGDGQGGFATAFNFNVGGSPNTVTVGDFNGDGKADLATANYGSNNVSMLLGDGLGNFTAAANFNVGDVPFSVTMADFNGDGKADLATANSPSSRASVLLGDGQGGFASAANFNVGLSPLSVTVGDFNGDGKADLATANFGSSNVSVLLGDGQGSFASAANFNVGLSPLSVTVGDFNGAGKADLATANFGSNNVSVLLGDGLGGFAAAAYLSVGAAPYSVTVADFNGDGKADLATANSDSNNVSVLLNTSPDNAPPARTLSATLTDGNLTVSDTDAMGKNNSLTVRVNGADLVISDSSEQFATAPAGAVFSNDYQTFTIPIAWVTGSLTFNTGGGTDTLTVDLSGGNAIPVGNLTFNGGDPASAPGDKLIIVGGDQGTVTYNYTSGQDGAIEMSNLGAVNYTGLESIVNSGTASDLIAFLPVTASNSFLEDDGLLGNGLSRLRSGTATYVTTDVANPTGSLSIRRGNAGDTLTVNALPDFNAGLNIGSAANPLGATTFAGAVTLGSGKYVSASSNTLSMAANAALLVSGGGAINLTADNIDISATATISAGSGAVTLTTATASRAINLGTKIAGQLSLTDAELDRVTAGTLQIGDGQSGAITVSAAITHGNNLSLTTAAGLNVDQSVTMAAGKSLSVNAGSTVSLSGSASDIAASGTGGVSFTSARNISLAPGSSIVTVNGALTLSANPAGTTAGDFDALDVNGAVIQSTGSGNLTLAGQGGLSGIDPVGVLLRGGGVISGGTSGGVSLTGRGGSGTGAFICGVFVQDAGSIITSLGANVQVNGTGGVTTNQFAVGVEVFNNGTISAGGTGSVTVQGTGGNAPDYNHGVDVSRGGKITSNNAPVQVTGVGVGNGAIGVSVFGNGLITSGAGANSVTVTGTGGAGSGGNDIGVYVASAQVTSGGGLVQVTGTGGGTGASSGNVGIYVSVGGVITASGSGQVVVNGGGGNTTGSGNYGVFVSDANSRIASSGGNIAVTGSGGPASVGMRIESNGKVQATTGSPTVTLTSDSMDLLSTTTVDAGGNTVLLRPKTAGTLINLGGADVVSGGLPLTLGLTDVELDRVTAGTLQIGDSQSGAVTVSAALSPLNYRTLSIQNGVAFSSTGGFAPIVASATVYQQMLINGAVSIASGATLTPSFTGYTPGTNDSFTLIENGSASATSGAFAGLAEGTYLTVGGKVFQISYVGGTGNDAVLAQVNNAPTATSIPPVAVDEDSPDTLLNLRNYFADLEDSAAGLSYQVQAVTGAAGLFSSTSIDNATGVLTLRYAPDAHGTANVTVRGTDTGGLFAETTFTVTVANVSDTRTWNGGGANNNWTTAANWVGNTVPESGDSVVFDTSTPGVARFTSTNDFVGLNLARISVLDNSPTQDFTLNGNALTLQQGIHVSGNEANTVVKFSQITLGADQSFTTSVAGQSLIVFSPLATSGHTLTTTGKGYAYFLGVISGSGGLIFTINGDTWLNAANTYTGPTQIINGNVGLQAAGTLGASAAGTTLSGNNAIVRFSSGVISAEPLTLTAQTGYIQGSTDALVTGPVNLATTGQTTVSNFGEGTFTVSGAISGNPGPDGLNVAAGAGNVIVFSGASTHAGATNITSGTLLANGSLSASSNPVAVSNGATLGGNGTISRPVVAASGGTLAPGAGPGVLSTGNVSLISGAIFNAELNGVTAGSGYDQLNVTGTVALGGSTLNTVLGFTPPFGSTFTLINNDGVDAVSGTFAGLAEGTYLTVGDKAYQISYVGGTGNDVVLARVNVVPTPVISGAPASSPEGTTISLTGSATDPSSVDQASLALSWSVTKDGVAYGSGGSGSSFSFTPDDDGIYVVSLTATDIDGAFATTSQTIEVTNVAPVPSNPSPLPPGVSALEGATLLFRAEATDAGALDQAAGFSFDWSVFRYGAEYARSTESAFFLMHLDAGGYVVTLTVTDKDNASQTISTGFVVTNVAPIVTLSGPTSASEGSTKHYTFSISDPGNQDRFTVAVVSGGAVGTVSNLAFDTSNSGGFDVAFRDSGAASTVTLQVRDYDGGTSNIASTAVVVSNVAPTATFANGGAVNEGSTGTVSFTQQTDLSSVDVTAGLRYAYDFDNNGTFDVGGATYATAVREASATVPASFLADGPGSRTVRGRIIDKDGDFSDYTTSITIKNVAPTIALSGADTVDVGTAYTLTLGNVVDPGTDTVSSYTIYWGDNSSTYYTGSPNGVSKTHVYDGNASPGGTALTISVSLTDEDGTFSSAGTKQLTVVGSAIREWGNLFGSTAIPLRGLTNVTSVAGGFDHGLALRQDGTVWAWGNNGNGQLGNGTRTNSFYAVPVSGLTNVVAIAAGEGHSLALLSDGTVRAWGYNVMGQLGNGSTADSTTPVPVSSLTGVTAIAAGVYHSLALLSDGTVKAWGYNYHGQLGNGSTANSKTPVSVSSLTGVTALAAGFGQSLALKSNGSIWAWGDNYYGQLGNGSTASSTTPVSVSSLTGVTAIAAGLRHSLALKSDGSVWAWGYNYYGQLGNGSTANGKTPVAVSNLTGVTSIDAGYSHSLALRSDGTVWAWGYNNYGQLGDGSTEQRSTPVIVSGLTGVASISAMGYSSIARLALQPAWVGSGSAVNGYLVGSTAFFDANFNGQLDPNEPSALTDATGKFDVQISTVFDTNDNGRLDDDEGRWVVFGGTDSSTGLPAVNTLTAPASWSVVTPLTTLVAALAAGYEIPLADAQERVRAALGLPAVDLSTLDPLAGTLAGDADAAQVFSAHARVQDTIAQVVAVLEGAGAEQPRSELAAQVMAQLAGGVLATESTLELADTAVIGQVLRGAAAGAGLELSQQIVAGAAAVIAATNESIDALEVTGDLAYLAQVAQVKIVSQGAVAGQLAQAAAAELEIAAVVEQNTGPALAVQVAAAVASPTLIVPQVVFVEATSAAGAIAEFNVSATDLTGQAVPVVTSPASGVQFPLGATTVTAWATDGAGISNSATFQVVVRDTIGPAISAPDSLIVPMNAVGGAYASFAASTAVDTVDPHPTVSTDIASGSFFPLGTSQVVCTAIDASGNVSQAIFTVTVIEMNNTPTANADSATGAEDGSVIINVLANDTAGPFFESHQTLYVSAANALHGTVTINANGTLLYKPQRDYNGPDTITYTIVDNGTTNGQPDPLSATGAESIMVTEVNDAPTGADDALSNISLDVDSRTISFASLLANDLKGTANESGQTLTIVIVADVLGGTAVLSGGNIIFTSTADYVGPAGFTYTLQDNGTTAGAADFKTSTARVSFNITAAATPARLRLLENGTHELIVYGTPFDDKIEGSVSSVNATTDKYKFSFEARQNGSAVSKSSTGDVVAPGKISRVVVYGLDGNDNIKVDGGPSVAAWLFGDAGNDVLNGAKGNNVLVGGDGNDTLQGGSGSEWLIGGRGTDSVTGAKGNDILTAGFTDYDAPTAENLKAVERIMAEWGSTASYFDRVHHLDGTLAGGLNVSASGVKYLVNASTVHDDVAADTLGGGGDFDWFLANLDIGIIDVLKDRKVGEIATDLS